MDSSSVDLTTLTSTITPFDVEDEYVPNLHTVHRKMWLTVHSLTLIRCVYNSFIQQQQTQRKNPFLGGDVGGARVKIFTRDTSGRTATTTSVSIDWNEVASRLNEIFVRQKIQMHTKPTAQSCCDKWHILLTNGRCVRGDDCFRSGSVSGQVRALLAQLGFISKVNSPKSYSRTFYSGAESSPPTTGTTAKPTIITAVATATLPRFVTPKNLHSSTIFSSSSSSSLSPNSINSQSTRKRSHEAISLNSREEEEEEVIGRSLPVKFAKVHDTHIFPNQSSLIDTSCVSPPAGCTSTTSLQNDDDDNFEIKRSETTCYDSSNGAYCSSSTTTATTTPTNSGTTSPLLCRTQRTTISECEREVHALNQKLHSERRAHMLREGSIRDEASKEIAKLKSELRSRDELLASIFKSSLQFANSSSLTAK